MEQYLLDLSPLAKKILTDEDSVLYISIASFWEITIKSGLGKLTLGYTIDDLVNACDITNILILPIEIAFLKELQFLPPIHNDPFDRIIASTAVSLNLTIITLDGYIKQYDLKTIW